jgi:hypothetical protein
VAVPQAAVQRVEGGLQVGLVAHVVQRARGAVGVAQVQRL